MNCQNCRNDLIGFIRGTLPGDLEIRVREHLLGCPECRSFADYLRVTLDVIRVEREVAPDPFLATRIEGLLSASASVPQRTSLAARLIPALAFSLFIMAGIAGGIGVGRMIAPASAGSRLAMNELTILIDDLQQEPIESFLLGMSDITED